MKLKLAILAVVVVHLVLAIQHYRDRDYTAAEHLAVAAVIRAELMEATAKQLRMTESNFRMNTAQIVDLESVIKGQGTILDNQKKIIDKMIEALAKKQEP